MIKAGLLLMFTLSVNILNAQNLSLKKQYTLSDEPNYEFGFKKDVGGALTDGVFTVGHFWTQGTTLGWKGKSKVTINIDLGRKQIVGGILVNTARGQEADVHFPQHIYVFLSSDNQNFSYAGDITQTKDNIAGAYLIKRFQLLNINESARYVILKIIPKGFYLFIDEIEILKGTSNRLRERNINVAKIDESVYELENFPSLIRNTIDELESVCQDKDEKSLKIINSIKLKLNSKTLKVDSIRKIRSKIGEYHAEKLRNRYKKPFLVEIINPWDKLKFFRHPSEQNIPLRSKFNLTLFGVQYGAFIITNTDKLLQSFKILLKNTNDNLSVELYNVPYVNSKDFILVPDPLLPINDRVNLIPGESRMFIYKIMGKKQGESSALISISSMLDIAYLSVQVNIKKVPEIEGEDLNALNWGYLNYPMVSRNKKQAIDDQLKHHINTIVIPSHIMPRPGDYNFKDLLSYLAHYPSVENILLYSNYSHKDNHHIEPQNIFLDDRWKDSFSIWYIKLLNELKKVTTANVYFYPFDEVNSVDEKKFIDFSIWAKKNVKGIKLFATFNKNESANSLAKYVDVAQILGDLNYNTNNRGTTEIWSYRTNNNSRALSPYSYYRLMAWEAYLKDYKGIGFWNYSDIGLEYKSNFIESNYVNWKDDYAIVYNDVDGSLLSSRRWEAFMLGIEDYRLLYLYGKKNGISKAKNKAREVLINSGNVLKADHIRDEILKAL